MSRPNRACFGAATVTGLSGYAGATNFYCTASPFVDRGGLSFSTDAGGAFNLGNAGVPGSDNIEMTLVLVVPEPASVVMMLAGALGWVGLSRRRAARWAIRKPASAPA